MSELTDERPAWCPVILNPVPEGSYRCAACFGVFEFGWSDEEAKAEADFLWGKNLGANPAIICDDCFSGGIATFSVGGDGLLVQSGYVPEGE